MVVLGLDTATPMTAVALIDGEEVLAKEQVSDRRHSVNLLPAMDRALKQAGMGRGDLDGVAVGIGPGSFTGIRIGLAVAKTLAFVLDKPLLGVSSLKALAYGAKTQPEVADWLEEEECQLCVAQDALKGEVFSARFRWRSSGGLETLQAEGARDPSTWAKELLELPEDGPFVVLGSGAERYAVMFHQTLESKIRIPREAVAHVVDAAAVAKLGLERLLAGESDDPMSLEPMYCRLSEAELGLLKVQAP
ncbi:MAG: tRNA (adenosine(37)-N6)-threonylcarbamoyltransferase complex dimerization subunit type 1 TsaB [Deltaproteobacteria bacterium]|nr:tRNA (adenosine(37)-N6)-threonylcarbamoyltransferase complex dimerization subunit type 1 TsaB [Deltaproteobacteria bacterium]